ncbi:hypothetical protein BDZ89DRAFT_972040 [Hymenopellis radicata]|nr:hypothetical protein BDZ89DRAFT_972040 [Hymenopellis radicata]
MSVSLTDIAAQRKSRTSTRRSAIFGFYEPDVRVVQRDTDTAKEVPHDAFRCYKCRGFVYRNRTTQDKSSGSELKNHANKCFGVEAVKAAMTSKDLEGTRKSVQKAQQERQTTLTGLLHKLVDKAKEVYSTIALTKAEVQAECARWCAENYRPFKIVADRAFKKLMKTGRPAAYIPHPTTVSRDTKTLFAKTRHRLAKHFKTLKSRLHIATDAWTSPNHKAFVAYTAHWEEDGRRVSTVLDFCELGEVRVSYIPVFS